MHSLQEEREKEMGRREWKRGVGELLMAMMWAGDVSIKSTKTEEREQYLWKHFSLAGLEID